jgi:peptidoglycan hydrolase CwlO-like protein
MGQSFEQKLEAAEQALAARTRELEAANVRVAELSASLADSVERVTRLQTDLGTAKQTIHSLQERIEALEKSAKTAEAKAAQICASVGVTPVPVTAKGEKPDPTITAYDRWARSFATR